MRLEPRFQIPDDPKEAVKALSERLRVLEDLVQRNTVAQTKVVNSEPSKPRDGMFAYADGTNWDPGYGRGLYQYQTDHWQPLGAAATPIDTAAALGSAQERFYKDNFLATAKRWAIGLDVAETGSHVGSELSFWSYDNTGASIRKAMSLDREAELRNLLGVNFCDGSYLRESSGELSLNSSSFNLPLQPSCHVYRNSTFALGSGAWQAIEFDSALRNVGTMFALASPTRITCAVAGLYLFAAGISFGPSTTGAIRGGKLFLNGSTNYAVLLSPAVLNGTSSTRAQLLCVLSLAVGDYVEVQAYQDSSGSLNLTGGLHETWCVVQKVA